MSEWKAGDVAMVKIVDCADGDDLVFLTVRGGRSTWLETLFLHPLPPAITPEERAVLQAALWWRAGFETVPIEMGLQALASATRALIASRTPPDPLAELVAAINEAATDWTADRVILTDRFYRALSAARAAVAK